MLPPVNPDIQILTSALGLRFSMGNTGQSEYWQHSLLSEIAYTGLIRFYEVSIMKDEDPEPKNVTSLNGFDVLSASHRIGYYPNTRTDFFLEYGSQRMDLGSAVTSGLDKIQVQR
jgi:hypothetical protein